MAEVTLHNSAITGTTTDSYPTTPQYQNKRIGGMRGKSIQIQNTGGSNGLTFQVKVKPNVDSDYINYPPGSSEQNLAANADAIIGVPEVYAEIAVEVKAQTSSNQTTFKISMTGQSR